MWIDVKNKEVILPSMSKVILVTDGQRPQLVTVEKFLETVDTPYNTWTHWMEIPKIGEELIFEEEEELDKLANAIYPDFPLSYGEYESCEDLRNAYKAGFRQALKYLYENKN